VKRASCAGCVFLSLFPAPDRGGFAWRRCLIGCLPVLDPRLHPNSATVYWLDFQAPAVTTSSAFGREALLDRSRATGCAAARVRKGSETIQSQGTKWDRAHCIWRSLVLFHALGVRDSPKRRVLAWSGFPCSRACYYPPRIIQDALRSRSPTLCTLQGKAVGLSDLVLPPHGVGVRDYRYSTRWGRTKSSM
jgi:hypothetical protein